jgi:hypothetical protein
VTTAAANAGEVATNSAAKTAAPAPAIGFTLHFDLDMQRFILEAREPGSGFVIYQIPRKYAVSELSGSLGTPTRGTSIDSAV